MNIHFDLPSRRETTICIVLWLAYFLLCSVTMGLRPEHILFPALFCVLFFSTSYTRKLAVCLIPFVLFAISYDMMRLYPNYLVNPVDIVGLHDADRSLFGITVAGQKITLNEFFAQHNCAFGDLLSGIFYLCWVPGPIAFGLYCFFTGRRGLFIRFAWAFLFINFLGFAGYYIHPASPPWFFAQTGGHITPDMYGQQIGSEAGLCRFDSLIGMPLFHDIYSRNANVFAALPSLHATYCLTAFVYALVGRCRWYVSVPLGVLAAGICWTAVYTSHHYVIDVLLGVALALTFILVWEKVLLKWSPVKHFYECYERYSS